MIEAILAGFFVYGVISAIIVLWEAIYWRKGKNLWLVINDPEELYEMEKLLYFLKERIPGVRDIKIVDLTKVEKTGKKFAQSYPPFQVITRLPEEINERNYIIFF
ncbi:hypothetical protein [Carboxydothermus pertinax]|uniref:Uncharacterized protein n=1 Tax=Carboxydothermus pertinax TaxID=870242 RepID=A0A1L8CVB1_9THEO|nr:hypothetical protein [Carboxydothermus pertinax]GAV22843.1 hypothetical protein cpu_13530 [Carboxydothermus pertinax]